MREVVGVDVVPELLDEARKRAPENAEFVEADAEELPFPPGAFDVVCTARTLHHVPRPELVLAEMTRVLRPGGTMLVVDQLAPGDPLAAIELNRFERARDPSTTRILADVDLRGLFDSNGLVLRRSEIGRRGARPRALPRPRRLRRRGARTGARARPGAATATYGWYVLTRPTV